MIALGIGLRLGIGFAFAIVFCIFLHSALYTCPCSLLDKGVMRKIVQYCCRRKDYTIGKLAMFSGLTPP